MGNVNRSRPDQQRLAPFTAERGNIGGISDDGCLDARHGFQVYSWDAEHLSCFRTPGYRPLDRLLRASRIANQSYKNFSLSVIGYHIGGATSGKRADVQSAGTKGRMHRQLDLANPVQDIEQLFDCRFAQMRVG